MVSENLNKKGILLQSVQRESGSWLVGADRGPLLKSTSQSFCQLHLHVPDYFFPWSYPSRFEYIFFFPCPVNLILVSIDFWVVMPWRSVTQIAAFWNKILPPPSGVKQLHNILQPRKPKSIVSLLWEPHPSSLNHSYNMPTASSV